MSLAWGLFGCVADADLSHDSDLNGPEVPDPAAMGPIGGGTAGTGSAGDGPQCTATLSVTCDGHEDCGSGQVCCGVWDIGRDRYAAVQCRAQCEDDAYQYELCHPGETCRNEAFACRNSEFLPAFLFRCLEPVEPVASDPSESQTPGTIRCGDALCSDQEQCCVRPPHGPYCAPRDIPCSCDDPDFDSTPAQPTGDAGVKPSDPTDAGSIDRADAGYSDATDAGHSDATDAGYSDSDDAGVDAGREDLSDASLGDWDDGGVSDDAGA